MKIIAITRKGPSKVENEDRIVIGRNLLAEGNIQAAFSSGIVAVADGVGGNNAGAIASHFVAQNLTAIDEVSQEVFAKINDDLLQQSETHADYSNMATTLSGICVSGRKTILFSVGNTRVYLLQGGKYLKQLTSDDTTLNYLLATGQLAVEDAESFSRKNEITACFGGGATYLFKIKCNPVDSLTAPFMMTSDGIHDYVSVDQMEDIIAEYGISFNACEALVATARSGGSQDDMSIVFGDVKEA